MCHRNHSQLSVGLACVCCLLVSHLTSCMGGHTPEPVPLAKSPSVQSAEQAPNPPAQKGAESAATQPAPRVDPKPRTVALIGGKVMLMGVDAEGSGVWRTPGVIKRVQGTFDADLVTAVQAKPGEVGRPAGAAGVQVRETYILLNGAADRKPMVVATVYREDGSVDPPFLLSSGENRTSVVPIIGGKSVLLVKNRWGQQPISAGTYDSKDVIIPSASKQPGAGASTDGFQVIMSPMMAAGGWLCFAPVYKVDGAVDPPHAWKCENGEIQNRTQVVELMGGESALLLADPKDKRPLLKGIYPADQLHASSDGILVREQYLTLEGDILNLDVLYGPGKPASFVGARLGDKPIQNRGQAIKLAGNRSAVFTADPRSIDGGPRFAGIQDAKPDPPVR